MVQKKVDSRIRTLIENGVKTNHRSFIFMVGDRGKDQIANLHYILSKCRIKARPSVLWCYKKDLGFSTHKQKRMRQIKKQIARGLYDPEQDNPFDLFISSTEIRWCYYKDSKSILGQTYGMCVLQDFEAVTPNLLCRTIETVEGGGIIVVLLKTMTSLKQFYTMTMDAHERFRTESHQDVVPRFNERFLLSLSDCDSCVVLDDELNILPISDKIKNIQALPGSLNDDYDQDTPEKKRLSDYLQSLPASLTKTTVVNDILVTLSNMCRTLDQAKALHAFLEVITDKTYKTTFSLTASRGRGKSASLGMCIAGAVAYGYSNIFVTAPSPENLDTLFDFIIKGLEKLKFKDHQDYEVIHSTNPEYNNAIIRINIFRTHRQTIQYILPNENVKLSQAELLVVDEAAAIPLPLTKKLLGNYICILSSTITGYEGTGRSLSIKLLNELRKNQGTSGTLLHEVVLEEPIRYSLNDPIEKWLYKLLCLDCTSTQYRLKNGCPHPDQCQLYYIDRDSLFSYHKLSEAFLQRIMSLYVSSHYKNSPDDLQLLSDAPAHHIFALLGPVGQNTDDDGLPDVYCVIQVCMEGQISRETVERELSQGKRSNGDMIPWTVCQQYQDHSFNALSGCRIVRIATHADIQGMGYGSRAIQLLANYYQGEITNLSDIKPAKKSKTPATAVAASSSTLTTEELKPRKKLPPLLVSLQDRVPERLHWIGVAYGLTSDLYNYYYKSGYGCVYIRQTENELTGEHSCIMIKPLDTTSLPNSPQEGWLASYLYDFQHRFISLLAYQFKQFPVKLALQLLDLQVVERVAGHDNPYAHPALLTPTEVAFYFTENDLLRLNSYSKNLVDYHMIMDLLPYITKLFYLHKFGDMGLSSMQQCILIGQGLQHKTVESIHDEFPDVPINQILALFNRAIRKFQKAIVDINDKGMIEQEKKEEKEKQELVKSLLPLSGDMDKELEKEGKSVQDKLSSSASAPSLKALGHDVLAGLDLSQYKIGGTDDDWKKALNGNKLPQLISVNAGNKKKDIDVDYEEEDNEKKTKKRHRDTNDKHHAKKAKKH
ncbi:hypothetical protein WA158_007648 [Blastocystis sp. Blastoise]